MGMRVFGPGTPTDYCCANDLLRSYTDPDYRREKLRYLNHNERRINYSARFATQARDPPGGSAKKNLALSSTVWHWARIP